jgi:hypothetical protein
MRAVGSGNDGKIPVRFVAHRLLASVAASLWWVAIISSIFEGKK